MEQNREERRSVIASQENLKDMIFSCHIFISYLRYLLMSIKFLLKGSGVQSPQIDESVINLNTINSVLKKFGMRACVQVSCFTMVFIRLCLPQHTSGSGDHSSSQPQPQSLFQLKPTSDHRKPT